MGAVVLERKTFVMKETKIQGKNAYKEVILITLFKAEFLLKGICFILVIKKTFSEYISLSLQTKRCSHQGVL